VRNYTKKGVYSMNREYCEMVVEGSLELVKGFVIGFLEGKGIQGEAIFGENHHVQNEDRLGHMLHLVGMKGNRLHTIIGSCSQQRLLKDALERRKEELDLKLVSEKRIVQASFVFRYRAYTKDLGNELKKLFSGLPEGLQIEDYDPKETVYPEGRGVEDQSHPPRSHIFFPWPLPHIHVGAHRLLPPCLPGTPSPSDRNLLSGVLLATR